MGNLLPKVTRLVLQSRSVFMRSGFGKSLPEKNLPQSVIPAQAGIQTQSPIKRGTIKKDWIPASPGMTTLTWANFYATLRLINRDQLDFKDKGAVRRNGSGAAATVA